eukprot:scaffold3056_cov17-Tisochrysis_lutea.AAC.2
MHSRPLSSWSATCVKARIVSSVGINLRVHLVIPIVEKDCFLLFTKQPHQESDKAGSIMKPDTRHSFDVHQHAICKLSKSRTQAQSRITAMET